MQRSKSKLRKFAVAVCLATIAGYEVSSLKFGELLPRFRSLPGFASMDADQARLHGSGFAFDRAYGDFLDSVRRGVPAGSTVALDAPRTSLLYRYSAAYVLAPRRVVPFVDLPQADFAAVYGKKGRASLDRLR